MFSKAAAVLFPNWSEDEFQNSNFKYDNAYKVVKGFHTAVCLGLPVSQENGTYQTLQAAGMYPAQSLVITVPLALSTRLEEAIGLRSI